MCSDVEARIGCAAKKAKNLLGQLGPLVWALHARHQCVGDAAEVIAKDPERSIQVAPGISDKVRQQAVADISTLVAGASGNRAMLSSANLREVINRSVVVYAVAGLEDFMDQAAQPVYRHLKGKKRWPRHFTGMCCLVEQQFRAINKPFACYREVSHLAQVRHSIIHNDGKVDHDFRDKVAKERLEFRLSDDGNSVIWAPGCSQSPTQDWDGKPVSIAIECFILPMLRHAQEFVREAERSLLVVLPGPSSLTQTQIR